MLSYFDIESPSGQPMSGSKSKIFVENEIGTWEELLIRAWLVVACVSAGIPLRITTIQCARDWREIFLIRIAVRPSLADP